MCEAAAYIIRNGQEELFLEDVDVIEPDGDSIAIGSGGSYAQAAAMALLQHTDMSAPDIARTAMEIAADLCIYTNRHIAVETLGI